MKNSIQENLGLLEEQFEQFVEINFSDETNFSSKFRLAKKSITEIREKMEEDMLWEESFALDLLIKKITFQITKQFIKNQFPVSFITNQRGKIAKSQVAAVSNIIINFISIAVGRMKKRYQQKMQATQTVYIELLQKNKFIEIRILDNAGGITQEELENIKNTSFYKTIKEIVAQSSAVVALSAIADDGLEAKVKIPQSTVRLAVSSVTFRSQHVAIPETWIMNIKNNLDANELVEVNKSVFLKQNNRNHEKFIPLFRIDSSLGLVRCKLQDIDNLPEYYFITIQVVDLCMVLIADQQPQSYYIRAHEVTSYMKENSWFSMLAMYSFGGQAKLVPLLNSIDLLNVMEQ